VVDPPDDLKTHHDAGRLPTVACEPSPRAEEGEGGPVGP
jgi:hypothetical protein